ncbi:MAG: hypothetical protein ACLPXM_19705 [Terriglobales bacterium]
MRVFRLLCVFSICILPAVAQNAAKPGTGWPKELDYSGTHFVVYQPEAESWKDGELRTRAVVMISETGGKPRYGTISISARTKEDAEHRSVTLENLEVVSGDFPSGTSDQERALAVIRKHLSEWPRSMPLDRLRADLGIAEAEKTADTVPLKNAPAKIIFSPRRAVLIQVDGDPVFREVEGTKYKRVINTPAMIVQDSSDQRLYLDGDGRWMTATALDGPWSEAQPPPADLERVKAQLNKADQGDQQEAAPAQEPAAARPNRPEGPPVAPAVYVTTSPAELIQSKGRPQFSPIPNTQLTYVTNSENDIFMYLPTQAYYTVLSGRWFTAKVLRGQWNPVADGELPQDFAKIPADSPKASVLASVPDTKQARQAVITSQIPETAAVTRKDAKLSVRYDGEPQFKPVEGTSLQYAVNTSTDVIQAEGKYYACHDAVWFVSATPAGPWVVADYIPAEIYRIPASSPLYHVRYVRVYSATPDSVYFGYTPGYMGAYAWHGVVVYGTGWAYPGWYGRSYFGWPWTWGLGFHYGFWGGGWFWRPGGWAGGWYGHPGWGARAWYGGGYWGRGWGGRGWAGGRGWGGNVYNRWGGRGVVTRNAQTRAAQSARANTAQTARSNAAHSSSQTAHTSGQKAGASSKSATGQAHTNQAGTANKAGHSGGAAGAHGAGAHGAGAHGAGAHGGKAGGARGGGRR